ncbi:MAG: NADH-quinone oxidoreductase subunit NuoK [Clostridia bacterium]|nr:NADH-quinone oxidoreductase subunit NuoK [Clostridia bacterium]
MGLGHYLVVAAGLFAAGLFGALAKKNAVAVLIGIELMLNAVNLNFVAFNRFLGPGETAGYVFAICVIVVAAAEVAVGLAIILGIYRRHLSTDVENFNWLKW